MADPDLFCEASVSLPQAPATINAIPSSFRDEWISHIEGNQSSSLP